MRPNGVSNDPFTLFLSLGVASLMLLLVAFPSSLFNETMEENYAVIAGWFARGGGAFAAVRSALAGLWSSPIGVLAFLVLSAVIYGFLDPSFGLSWESLTLVLGIVLGLLITTLFFELPIALFQRSENRELGAIRVLPLSLLVAIVCVLASRALDFQPGYIYGLVAFYAFTRGMTVRSEGMAVAATCVVILGLSLAAWLLLPVADAALEGSPFFHLAATAVLVTIFVGGLEGLLFELFPLRFLRGKRLWDWHRGAWVVLFLVSAFVFVHLLIVPTADYLIETSAPALITAMGFLIAFTLVSVAVWAYFRRRAANEPPLFSSSPPVPGARGRR